MTRPSEQGPRPSAEGAVLGVAYAEAIAARDPRPPRDTPEGSPGKGRAGERSPREPYRRSERSTGESSQAPYDPLKLCVYATVALLAWLFGPWAVLGFAMLGFTGYWRARRAGLLRSKCLLRDTRLVLAYLALVALVAVGALVWQHLPR